MREEGWKRRIERWGGREEGEKGVGWSSCVRDMLVFPHRFPSFLGVLI